MLVVLAVLVKCERELLDGRDDNLICVVVRQESADKRRCVGVFFDTGFLEPVELLASLTVEVLAVDHEEALVDALVGLKERRRFKGGEGLAGASRMPDVTVAAVLVDALDDRLDGVDLIGPHYQQLLLAGHEN